MVHRFAQNSNVTVKSRAPLAGSGARGRDRTTDTTIFRSYVLPTELPGHRLGVGPKGPRAIGAAPMAKRRDLCKPRPLFLVEMIRRGRAPRNRRPAISPDRGRGTATSRTGHVPLRVACRTSGICESLRSSWDGLREACVDRKRWIAFKAYLAACAPRQFIEPFRPQPRLDAGVAGRAAARRVRQRSLRVEAAYIATTPTQFWPIR